MQGPWVQSLVGELRSHKLQSNWIHVPPSTAHATTETQGSQVNEYLKKKKGTEEHGRKMQIAKVGRKLSVQVNKQTEESFYQY